MQQTGHWRTSWEDGQESIFFKIALIQWSPTFSPPPASLGGDACFLLAHGFPAAAAAATMWGLEGEC